MSATYIKTQKRNWKSIRNQLILGVVLVMAHGWLIKAHLQGPSTGVESLSPQPYHATVTAWQAEYQSTGSGS
jgi:hypothetical protein